MWFIIVVFLSIYFSYNKCLFFTKYSHETSCKAFFKSQRLLEYSVCKECGSLNINRQEKKIRWRCKECKHAMGLKMGTVWRISISLIRYGFGRFTLYHLPKKHFLHLSFKVW